MRTGETVSVMTFSPQTNQSASAPLRAIPHAELALRIYRAAFQTGTFRLRSGAISHEYFDKYRFAADPVLLRDISAALRNLVPEGTEALAGLELGGVPIATLLSQVTGLPTLFVRKQAKPYGTCQFAEGGAIYHRRLLIIEDVVTSGGQVLESARALREAGAVITVALCVIDRDAGGAAALECAGVRLHSLFKRVDFPGERSSQTRAEEPR
jgi:orotate phosphoribosyltransferase